MIIRKAKIEDCTTLSELAYKSKGYWGYSKEFLEYCKDDLQVTAQHLDKNHIYVMEEDNRIIAFYTLSLNPPKLDALFIDPDYIGKGIGKILWGDLLVKAKQLHMKKFTLDSEPHAEGFYIKMGAQRIGEIASTVFPERKLPLMIVNLA